MLNCRDTVLLMMLGVRRLKLKHILWAICLVFILKTPAFANEPVIYGSTLSQRSALLLKNYVQKTLKQDFEMLEIAAIDLNQDGLPEFILKPKTCDDPDDFCSHEILAETDNEIVTLGHIEARKIALSHSYSYGVRNLWGYTDRMNDFNHRLYAWDPDESRYILLEKKLWGR